MEEKIEILSVELLDQHSHLVERLKKLAQELGIEFGWHYLLDLAWIVSHLGLTNEMKVLDAGAGTGLIQWYLAEENAQVMSVDRESRAMLSMRFRARYRVQGMRTEDLIPADRVVRENIRNAGSLRAKTLSMARGLAGMMLAPVPPQTTGTVIIYNQDLGNLEQVPDKSQDAVVAVSALEHNDPGKLPQVVEELMRVVKPGGALLATLGAAKDKDWFHEPSNGWCYTDSSLRKIFDLNPDVPSNYQDYDNMFLSLKECEPLHQDLASFYFQSGDNGMPWGIWDPQYQSVGVLKRKPFSEWSETNQKGS